MLSVQYIYTINNMLWRDDMNKITTFVPEGDPKLLSNWRQIWVITDDDWNMAAELASLEAYEQIVQAVIKLADQQRHTLDLAVVEHAPCHVIALC